MYPWKRPSKLKPDPTTPADADLATERCLNCGAVVSSRYCPDCGQEHSHKVVSVWRLLNDFLGEVFSWDSKLLHTLGHLLFAPGLLTEEYVKGRRARYLSPFRLYLYASAAMFYLLSVQVSHMPAAIPKDPAKQAVTDAKTTSTVVLNFADSGHNPTSTPEQYLKQQESVPEGDRDSALVRAIKVKALKLRNVPGTEIVRRLTTGSVQNAPKGMFFLLPVFALLLKVIYWRRGRLYIEHLVFALHCHAFVFAMLSADIAWQVYAPHSAAWTDERRQILGVTLFAVTWLYLLLAMKRVYQQGWVKTTVKLGLLAAAYSVLMLIALVGVVAFSLLSA